MNIKELSKKFEEAKMSHRRGQVNFNNIVNIFVGLLVIALIAVLYFISVITVGGVSTNGNVTTTVISLLAVGNTVVSFVPVIAIVAIIVAVLLALRFLQQ